MSFIAIPLDVLLEITRDLDFPDSFHLAATCTTCIPLLLSRSFWIIALNRLEQNHRRPLPCSPGLDISFLPLETLRKMAIHAYKLWRNWSSQSPNPISIHSFTIDDSLFHCLPIPGTRFIIVISRQRFACWETISGECIASMDHDSEPQWTPGLTPHVLPGIWSVGLLYASSNGDGLEFTTIRCDHRDPLAVKFSKTFSKVWTPTTTQTPLVSDIALVDGMLAAITITHAHDEVSLLFCRFSDGIIGTVPLGSKSSDSALPRCIVSADGFYVTRQYFDKGAEIIDIRSSATHPSTIDDFQIETVLRNVPTSVTGRTADESIGFCNIRIPKYGVLNVTRKVSHHAMGEGGRIDAIHFWPAERTNSRLSVGEFCFYEHPCRLESIAVGSSATCAITMDGEHTFGLVQYSSQPTPHVKFRRLSIPGVEVKSNHSKIALDDGMGILYIVDTGADAYPMTRTYPVGGRPIRLIVVSYV
ncbi:hypothetical protein DFH09DRAFT_1209865 [Mycena vulgaris]|nr:hypothetical protein DFH09DRAFT_1209865 [Mycena vulgaris]